MELLNPEWQPYDRTVTLMPGDKVRANDGAIGYVEDSSTMSNQYVVVTQRSSMMGSSIRQHWHKENLTHYHVKG